MYMTNTSPNAKRPNATYIPPARIGARVGIIGSRWALLATVGHYWLALGGGLRLVRMTCQIPRLVIPTQNRCFGV